MESRKTMPASINPHAVLTTMAEAMRLRMCITEFYRVDIVCNETGVRVPIGDYDNFEAAMEVVEWFGREENAAGRPYADIDGPLERLMIETGKRKAGGL